MVRPSGATATPDGATASGIVATTRCRAGLTIDSVRKLRPSSAYRHSCAPARGTASRAAERTSPRRSDVIDHSTVSAHAIPDNRNTAPNAWSSVGGRRTVGAALELRKQWVLVRREPGAD